MNFHQAKHEDCMDILSKSEILDDFDLPGGGRMCVAVYADKDVLIIQEPYTGSAIVIESDDSNYGGSVHDHARHCLAAGLL
jgi:hypothetical protein